MPAPGRVVVLSRYALQRMNKDREKQHVENLEHMEACDAWKDVRKHINRGGGRICKELVN
mgnify:CR=1 FL=1